MALSGEQEKKLQEAKRKYEKGLADAQDAAREAADLLQEAGYEKAHLGWDYASTSLENEDWPYPLPSTEEEANEAETDMREGGY